MRWGSLCLALGFASSAWAYDVRRDSSGTPVRWDKPVHFRIDAHSGEKLALTGLQPAITAALATWQSVVTEVPLTVDEGASSGLGFDVRAGAENSNDIVVLDEDWPYDDNALAVTVLTVDIKTHAILDADIAINAVQRKFSVLPEMGESPCDRDDVQNTLTHEFGHALGLAHSLNAASVMFAGSQPGEVHKRLLTQDDEDGLHVLYPGVQAPAASANAATGCSTGGQGASAGGLLWVSVLGFAALLSPPRRLRARAARALPFRPRAPGDGA